MANKTQSDNFIIDSNGKIIVNDGVKVIERNAFTSYTYATEVILPDSVLYIEEKAFSGLRALEKVVLSKNLISIGDNAFDGCDSLTSITLPSSVTSIGNYSFNECFSLKEVIWPDVPESKATPNLCKVGNKAFYKTSITNLIHKGIKIEKGLFIKDNTVEYPSDCNIVDLVIPDNIEVIRESGFVGCKNLKSVKIGSGVKIIEEKAFANCTSLKNVSISENVEEVKDFAFVGCCISNIDNKKCNIKNGLLIKDNKLLYCSDDSLAKIDIPEGVTQIGKEAFWSFDNLEEVTIPSSVKAIRAGAFFSCSNLKEVKLGTVDIIEEKAFFWNDKLSQKSKEAIKANNYTEFE